jgi:CheY-like chemotaxis protein
MAQENTLRGFCEPNHFSHQPKPAVIGRIYGRCRLRPKSDRLGPKSNGNRLSRALTCATHEVYNRTTKVPNNSVNLPTVPLVCIVDDDSSMASSTRFLVRSFGFRAEAFLSAQQFLDSGLVKETKCLILILDLRMPGIDGLELQRTLMSANERIPIIFISARATEDERTEAIAGGAVDFLSKPFSEKALFNALQVALNQSNSR